MNGEVSYATGRRILTALTIMVTGLCSAVKMSRYLILLLPSMTDQYDGWITEAKFQDMLSSHDSQAVDPERSYLELEVTI